MTKAIWNVSGMVFLLIVATPAFADAALEKAEGDYMLCVRRAAVRFEPSGESPQDIATAAVWACVREGLPAMNLLLRDPNTSMTPVQLVSSAKQAAIGQVVGARLCRKNKDCDYASPN